MAQLTDKVARQFFSSLYQDRSELGIEGDFDMMATRLVAKTKGNVSVGDQALQSLMFNYILSSPENVKKGKTLASVLGNIKQRAIMAFTETFPSANLDELITNASAAGYDVEVLGAR